jgi:bacterioferritin-associated ferredoxin
MFVCHCEAVSDRTVRAAIAEGNQSLDDLARSCGAGSRCGGCHPVLAELLGSRELDTVGAAA